MPGNKKSKNKKVYRCEICNGAQRKPVVACDKCEKWHHFSCVGLTNIGKKDPWICCRCQQEENPRTTMSTHESTQQESASRHERLASPSITQQQRPRDNDDDFVLKYDAGHPYHRANSPTALSSRRNFDNRSVTRQQNRHYEDSAKTTKPNPVTSTNTREEIELIMIDEERVLAGLRDSEYLKKKYSILAQQQRRSSRLSITSEDVRSSRRTRDWINEQRSVRSTPVDLGIKRARDDNQRQFNKTMEALHLYTSSEAMPNYPTPTKNLNQPKIPGIGNLLQCAICQMAGEDEHFIACLLCFRQCHFACMDVIMLDEETRYICSSCKYEDRQPTQLGKERSAKPIKTCSNWDTQTCPKCLRNNNPERFRSCDVCQDSCHYTCMSLTTINKESYWICSKCEHGRIRSSARDDTNQYQHFLLTSPSKRENVKFNESNPHTDTLQQPHRKLERQPSPKLPSERTESLPLFQCGTCRSTKEQKTMKPCDVCDTMHHFACLTLTAIDEKIVWICSQCKHVKSKSTGNLHRDQRIKTSKLPVGNVTAPSQSVTMSANTTTQTLTSAQIASRHVVTRDLPVYSGQPDQWPMFVSRFENSTKLCGFSDSENLDRLQKCLKGNALEAVRSRLLTAESVPEIMSTLEMLYGRPELIVDVLMKKIRSKAPPKADQLNTMIDFALSVKNVCATLEQANLGYHLSNPALIHELVNKLPTNFKVDWARYKANVSDVTLSTLGTFLFDLAKVISSVTEPTLDKDEQKPKRNSGQRDSNNRDKDPSNNYREAQSSHVYAHQSQNDKRKPAETQSNNTTSKPNSTQCKVCQKKCPKVEQCPVFLSHDLDRRWKEMYQLKLCRKCLEPHGRFCNQAKICGVNGCVFKHHSLLHDEKRHSVEAIERYQQVVAVRNNNIHFSSLRSVLLRIVPVTLHWNNRFIFTFAYQDDGSDVTMIEHSLSVTLGITGNVEPLCLMWTAAMHRKENNSRRVNVLLSGQGQFSERFLLRDARTVETLGLPFQTVIKERLAEYFPYRREIPLLDYYNAVPQILIGSDNANLNAPLEIVEGNFNQPIACKTRIGWSIHGRTDDRIKQSDVKFANIHRTKCPCPSETDDAMHRMVKEHFTVENFGVQLNKQLQLCSKEDERALHLLEKYTRQIGNRYETALLWRYDDVKLPDSYGMALKRLQCLERHKPEVIDVIDRTIQEYVQKGYATKLTDNDIRDSQEARIWYLPIFTVTYPKKPDKVRVVFDGAAKVNGVSLNSLLLKGPDQLSSLVDILRRFREKAVASAGDITEMFPQIKIRREDKHCQRFLWRNGDTNKKPDQYVLEVMTFGANCSPTSAQFVKNQNANKFKEEMPRAVESIIHNHYVDDMLDCQHTDNEMIQLIKDVKHIHSSGGFTIKKFLSNSAAVRMEFNKTEIDSTTNKCLDMSPGTERVLGMWWNTDTDCFTYSLTFTKIDPTIVNGERMPTKRELLKILMTIFDPLGLLSHYLIHLKIVIQDIWRSKLDWDEEITSNAIQVAWKQWFELLPLVEHMEIPRLYSTTMSPTEPRSIELHMFVDAGEKAFAAVAYLRIEDSEGNIECALVGSKARVSPLKYLSTPRLELQAGLLGSRLMTSVQNAQTIKFTRRQIWTDSRTLLSWLHSDHRRYHQFVAYRVGEILECTNLNEWRWIASKDNVADDATKWSKPPSFDKSNRWYAGPEFLKLPRSEWPDDILAEPDTMEEIKVHFAHSKLIVPILIDPTNISSWNKLHRALAYARRYILILRARVKREPVPRGILTREELQVAEFLLLRQAQFQDFTEDMVLLIRNQSLPSDRQQYVQPSSPLYKCTPYLDENGLIRMHGRIDAANDVAFSTKRPIILPRNNRITRLLVNYFHTTYHHRNHRTVFNEIRQKYYVPQLRVVLNSVRDECQRCKNKRARALPPQMADLPPARLAIGFRAFTNVGIDYFGPMYVVIGRRTEKRWGVMFTCLTVRAVHVEIAYKLDTESCIMCIRNFTYWRGYATDIYSDPGTNFTGTDNELQRLVAELDVNKMASEFTSCYTKWHFNPPASPHMGGAWERMIQSVKTCLYDILPTRHPTEDMLRNLLLEVCNIINSRPLTYIPIEHENDEILTPNHFILGSSNGLKPFVNVDSDGPMLRSKWMENQRLTDIFWTKFIKEFLPDLTRRTRWHTPVQPIQVGDIVLLVDGTNIRGQYPMCRVIATQIGSNNQVRRARIERFSNEGSKLTKSIYWRPATSLAKLDVHPRVSSSVPPADRQTEGSVMNDSTAPGAALNQLEQSK